MNLGDEMSSACFTGHRKIKCNVSELKTQLYDKLQELILHDGLTIFYIGGARGFDEIAARIVLLLREQYQQIELHLILPYSSEEQTVDYSDDEKAEYFRIKELANSVEYIDIVKIADSMKKRNAKLVECADSYCICYYILDMARQ